MHKKLSWRHPCSISTNHIRSPQYSALLPHFFCMATCYLRIETFFVLLNWNWSLSPICVIVVVILVSYSTESYAYIIHYTLYMYVCTSCALPRLFFHTTKYISTWTISTWTAHSLEESTLLLLMSRWSQMLTNKVLQCINQQ